MFFQWKRDWSKEFLSLNWQKTPCSWKFVWKLVGDALKVNKLEKKISDSEVHASMINKLEDAYSMVRQAVVEFVYQLVEAAASRL